METKEFRKWHGLGKEVEDNKAILFCYGNPGVGKTFIRYKDYSHESEGRWC